MLIKCQGLSGVGGLRRRLDLHAAVCGVSNGENPVRQLERA
jgi:hypothetical protein